MLLEIIMFPINCLIELFNTLRIQIPNTSITVLGLFITFIAVDIIYSFILSFFKINKSALMKTKLYHVDKNGNDTKIKHIRK